MEVDVEGGELPVIRELVGGVTDGVWGVVLSPIAAVSGAIEGAGWVSAGFLDTLTGGALAISPDGIAQLHASLVLQLPEGHRSYEAYARDQAPAGHAGCDAD